MEINKHTAGLITLTPLTKSGAPRVGLQSHGLAVDYAKHDDGSITFTRVVRYIVDRGITDAESRESVRYTSNPRMAVQFTSVAEAPYLAKQFVRLYSAQEMAVSDCE